MEIRSNRQCMRVLNVVSICLLMAAISFSICDARASPRRLADKAPSSHRSSLFLITAAKLNLVNYLNADSSTNSGSYGVSSPFNMPPYDSLAPIPLPQNAPPYCIDPPNGPQTPSVPIPSPIGSTPSSPPFYYLPPTLPFENPPPSPLGEIPSPSGGISGPSGPGFSPNPPGSFVPSPSGGIPSPSGGFPSPSIGIPSPSSGIPSPSGEIPSPSRGIPSPSGEIPSPSEPGFSPSPNPPGPFVPSPSSPGFSPNPNPPGSFIPSPPESVPSPSSELSPPYYEPSPPYYEPSPPYLVPSPPSSVPSPIGRVPSPRAFHPPIVYPPPQGPPPRGTTPIMVLWCVAKPTVPDPIILEAMNYACGSGADCDSIQPDGSCYEPNSLLAHASFAFNSYWQRTKVAGGTCEFGGTAILVSVDPSSGGCHYASY